MTRRRDTGRGRSRKKTAALTKQRTLRFGQAEEEAVESVRSAMSTTRGKPVGFSEALRLLILDKEGTAEVEARALAMSSGNGAGVAVDITAAVEALDRCAEIVSEFRVQVGRLGGNVNQIARNLNRHHDVPPQEVRATLAAIREIEHRISNVDEFAYRFERRFRGS